MNLFLTVNAVIIIIAITALLTVFSKQIKGYIHQWRGKLEKNIKTSAKIRRAIDDIKEKESEMKTVFDDVSVYIAKLKQAYNKEVTRAIENGEVYGVLLEDQFASGRIKTGTKVKVDSCKSKSYTHSIQYYECSTEENGQFNVRDTEIDLEEGESRHLSRCTNLRNMVDRYSAKNDKIEATITSFAKKRKTLNGDAEYVEMMESLKDVAAINSLDCDADIANIMAEIEATEKSLELEEKLSETF